jgi:glycosyltransferase involved in cell wall biosynthesis
VHALRIPYEGMVAALADPTIPLIVSVWGNDFTLHAVSNSKMGALTRQTLKRTNALLADCQRDIRLAKEWGLPDNKPTAVMPGGGGINANIFYPPSELEDRKPIVLNPRGMRSYVRNDVFFSAIPQVLEKISDVQFICPVMQGEAQPEKWVRQYGIEANVELLPRQTQQQMADLYRSAVVAVSPSEHDGTPNTLLEAMACGCFPVTGDIESVREWITDGENGLLVDPADSQALANAIIQAMEQNDMRRNSVKNNIKQIIKRAENKSVMKNAEEFYLNLVSN